MTCTNIHMGAWRRLASLSKSPNLERECCCRGEDNKATEKPRGHKNQNRFWFPILSHLQNNLRCIRTGIFSCSGQNVIVPYHASGLSRTRFSFWCRDQIGIDSQNFGGAYTVEWLYQLAFVREVWLAFEKEVSIRFWKTRVDHWCETRQRGKGVPVLCISWTEWSTL